MLAHGFNYDLGLLGFDSDELAKLLDPDVKAGLCDPDEVPEPPDEAVTQTGDLWLLGKHRLLCGDAGKTEDVDRLLGGAAIHLVNTDPPYNVKVEPRSNNAIAAGLSSFEVTHHQKLDVVRHTEKARPTGKKLRPKDRPLANDFHLRGRLRPHAARLVRQPRPRVAARPGVLHLGRLRQLRQLPAGAEGV